MIGKISAETIFRLSTMDRLLTEEPDTAITPDTERTRPLSDLLTAGGTSETAYTRTLLLAYEWIHDALECQFVTDVDTVEGRPREESYFLAANLVDCVFGVHLGRR